jgi:malate synthase
MGGMSAFIPVKGDEAANASAFDKVRLDKEREVHNGHDGTWVAHPGLVAIARAVFDAHMPGQNQRDKIPAGTTTPDMLLIPAAGPKTRAGLALNINVAIHYLAAWLRGQGAVPIHNMMEDAATAEISRCQVWQWYHTNTLLAEGVRVDEALITQIFNDELAAITAQLGAQKYHEGHYESAARLLKQLILAPDCADFLTIPAYALLNAAQD